MYQKPTLARFGSFRELTLGGGNVDKDNATILDNTDSCLKIPKGYQCIGS